MIRDTALPLLLQSLYAQAVQPTPAKELPLNVMSEWISNQNTVTHSPGNIMSYEKFWKPLRRFQDFDRLGAQSIVDVIKGIQYIMGGINGREASWCLRTG